MMSNYNVRYEWIQEYTDIKICHNRPNFLLNIRE